MKLRNPRRALLAFIAAVALPFAAPAMASASITPSLALVPTSISAGATQSLGFDLGFAPTTGDSPNDVSVTLPVGLLPNATIDGGACLLSATPATGCEVGTGTATVASVATPVSLWLVKAPGSSDLAGAALVEGTTASGTVLSTAAVDLTNLQIVLSFTSLPNLGISELDLTLTNLRAPTSCPATPATVNVSADSALSTTVETTSAPLTVTGCSTLPFTPVLTATATKDAGDDNVLVTTDVTQTAGQAADKTLTLAVPAAVTPNATNAISALGSGATVGTATATSPLIPIPLSGKVTLTGSALAPNLTVTFPAPFSLVLEGAVNLNTNSVTFSDVPDVPLTSLGVTLTGGANGVYETACSPSSGTLAGSFTGQNGAAATSNVALAVTGCPTSTGPGTTTAGKPTTSGTSLGGLVKSKPKFAFTAIEGKNAKPIKTITVSLPSGLSFSSKAKSLKKGIIVKGAGKFTYKVSHGVLTITLSSPASMAQVTLESPAVSVSSKLAKSVKAQIKKHKVTALSFKVKVTDSGKTTTTLTLKLKPKS